VVGEQADDAKSGMVPDLADLHAQPIGMRGAKLLREQATGGDAADDDRVAVDDLVSRLAVREAGA